MYDTEVNDNHVGFLENLFDYQQHHQDIYLKVKKPLLYYMKIKFVFFGKENPSTPPISNLHTSVYDA